MWQMCHTHITVWRYTPDSGITVLLQHIDCIDECVDVTVRISWGAQREGRGISSYQRKTYTAWWNKMVLLDSFGQCVIGALSSVLKSGQCLPSCFCFVLFLFLFL